MVTGLIALTALAIDAAAGWPDRLYRVVGHPVGGFARLIDGCETILNRPAWGEGGRRVFGILTMALLIGGTVLAGIGLEAAAHHWLGAWWWIAVAILAWPALAQRSLHDHVRPVADALIAGDLPAARRAVARIVGRDTDRLDEAGISRAAIESLAESLCDGVVAPLFWLLLGGLPGIWAYKAINTTDSLIGHREPRWLAFGWAAARIDDVANLLPARLSGLLLCIAGPGGWRVMMRDHARHASPNGGWPEAAMAGGLGIRLAGPVAYDGVTHMKPPINAQGRAATAVDVGRALIVYRRACLLLWLIAGGIAWVR